MNFHNIDYRDHSPTSYLKIFFEVDVFQNNMVKRVRHYTIFEHTRLVIRQFDKYFYPRNLPESCDLSIFRLILAVHDIGKFRAFQKNDRFNQWKYTIPIVEEVSKEIGITESNLRFISSILKHDSLGLYMQDKISDIESKKLLEDSAKKVNFDPRVFFEILTVYYQCDVASYTKDGGGKPFLEHLFLYKDDRKVFDENFKRLLFSENYERKFIKLKELIHESY